MKITKDKQVLRTADIQARKKDRVACKLAPLLPPSALACALGLHGGMPSLVALGAPRILDAVQRILRTSDGSHADGAFSALVQLLAFVQGLGVSELTVIDGSFTAQFLDAADAAARSRASAAAAKSASTPGRKRARAVEHDGHTVLPGLTASLKFLTKKFCIDVGTLSPHVVASGASSANPTKKQVISASLFVVVRLEQMANNQGLPLFVRATAAFFVLLAFACLRDVHGQRGAVLQELSDSGFFIGRTAQRKHCKLDKRLPFAWTFHETGTEGTSTWVDAITESLIDGAELGEFLLRDNDAPCSDPFKAKAWLNAPMSQHDQLAALRSLLRHPAPDGPGLPDELATRYSLSSFRHFLPEVAQALRLGGAISCELGAWHGFSDAQLGSAPSANMAIVAAETRLAALPTHYAPQASEMQRRKAFSLVMDAVRTTVTRVGPDKLPVEGGWDLVSATPAAHAGSGNATPAAPLAEPEQPAAAV